jgi:peptidoglycan/LPS O-acetylase OafA/YrhL
MQGRLPTLDGVRGVAILLVVAHNFLLLEHPAGIFGYLVDRVLNFGWVGVQLFFVLSGFLITRGLLEDRGAPDYFRNFYTRRILRIFPLYYATLILTFFVLPAFDFLPETVAADAPHQWWLWLFLSNWSTPYGIGGNSLPHFWSLAVEEQFYLVWPLIVRYCSPRQLIRVCFGLFVASLTIRCGMLLVDINAEAVYESSLARMDALTAGAAVATAFRLPALAPWLVAHRDRILIWTIALACVGLFVTHGYSRILPLGQTLGYSILAMVFAGLIATSVAADMEQTGGWANWLRFGPLRRIGKYSFAMYVFHKPLHDWIGVPFLHSHGLYDVENPVRSIEYMIVLGVICFALAAFSYHFIERHFLRMKDRLGSRSPGSAVA